MIHRYVLSGLAAFVIAGGAPHPVITGPPDEPASTVRIVGAMKNVMRQGQLYGIINLDTIADKRHLYGLGPVEYLSGEILIVDGRSYVSTVESDTSMTVQETYAVRAPFFVYAHVAEWREYTVPDSIRTMQQLETWIDALTAGAVRPFAFRLSGEVEKAVIHIVNLPEGAQVRSPEEAHRGQKNFELRDEKVHIVGFFSTEHQAVFTHHDTYVHMHLITHDHTGMGHLDEAILKAGTATLYLPEE